MVVTQVSAPSSSTKAMRRRGRGAARRRRWSAPGSMIASSNSEIGVDAVWVIASISKLLLSPAPAWPPCTVS